MAFTNMKLTTFGSNIEAKCHQGKGLHFTRIAVGDGLLGNGSMINRTALVSERHSMQIDGIIATENTTQSAVIATLDNSVFTEGFYYREIALFAKDPDTNQEGAYLYDNAGQECEFLGLREDGVVIYERIKMLIRVEQTSQISFDGSGNPLYMSPEDVRGMIEQHNVSEDAHKTKADLGNDGLLKDSQRPKADGLYMPDGKTKISDKIVNIESAMLLALAAASPYSAAAAYAQGAYCTKDGKLYRCTVAIPQAEAWNAAHWTATTMGAELVAIYTTLANKAPGGFGLGIPANLANGDVNERHGNGFYEWGSIKPKNAPTLLRGEGTYMYMFEFGDDAGFTQIMGCYIQTSPGLICRQAFAKSGSVQFAEWEWINPPMALNTEYRTTERYMGRSVYKKLVALGEAPSTKGTKEIFPFGEDYSVGTYNVFSVDAHLSNYANDGGWTITTPHFSINGELVTDIKFSGVRIDFYSSGMTGYYGFALLKYTKLNE